MAERTGLEPATPGVTGRYSNQLNYRSALVRPKSKLKAWRCSTLTWGNPTLPSTLFRFTSEFGMDSGGSKTLWSPSKFCFCLHFFEKSESKKSGKLFMFSTHSMFLHRVHQNPLGVVWLSLTGN